MRVLIFYIYKYVIIYVQIKDLFISVRINLIVSFRNLLKQNKPFWNFEN